ncbi:alpha/beta fold hydrolase [Chryseobacterium sp.]|uniref:esterase/lipase family protein n=1 Tax=Chryseobacterium sp. TaxID=1871047 RepID=UPI00289903BB|nr:alpha/beta fold hydrolase [Chryseobacterium sp.]
MITHIKDPKSDKYIVFIHGLGGSKNTFKKFSEYLSENWRLDFGFMTLFFSYYKALFDNKVIRILFLLFPSFIIKSIWSKRNDYNADQLDKYIDNECKNCNNIIIVAHSMGGLVARQYLVNCRKSQKDIRKIKMLITYGTPHKGSHIASLLSINNIPGARDIYNFFSEKFNYRISPQIGDLAELNKFIVKLNEEWRDYDLERKLLFIRVIGTTDKFVRAESGHLHEKDLENIYRFEYGHSKLIKPSNGITEFPPIDLFIDKISSLRYEEEYFEELEEEINYDEIETEDF